MEPLGDRRQQRPAQAGHLVQGAAQGRPVATEHLEGGGGDDVGIAGLVEEEADLADDVALGDVVDLGEASGTVEAVSLRVTRLRDVNGTVWYVRNGEIIRVGNMSQNWARTVLDIGVSYYEDLVRVRNVLKDVADDLWEDEDFQGLIIEEPEVWGVEALSPEGVTVRVTLKTAPMEQWAVAREMRQRIKARFDYEGIEIPRPQRMVWHRNVPDEADEDAAESTTSPTGHS